MMALILEDGESLVNSPQSLSPLPDDLRKGLTAVSILGFLSLISSSGLLIHLIYRLATWKNNSHARANQFVVLIFNLILADIQQSVAFLLNVQWVRHDAILVGTTTCWSQGWFVSTGDLASGLFTLAIAIHSFADIVYDFRLSRKRFLTLVISLWSFTYLAAILGLAMHPGDLYTRAGAWCWINKNFLQERLWLHYIWVIMAEFGTFLIYAAIFLILHRRVRNEYYNTSTQLRARSAARLIIAYPIVYVVCTLPLVIARLKNMSGFHITFIEYSIAGAMITSNGWLDVLLYSITRHNVLFGPELTNESVRALDTFTNSNWRPDNVYGNTTVIKAERPKRPPLHQRLSSRGVIKQLGSLDDLDLDATGERMGPNGKTRGMSIVKTETVVEVTRSEVELDLFGRPTLGRERKMSDGNIKGEFWSLSSTFSEEDDK